MIISSSSIFRRVILILNIYSGILYSANAPILSLNLVCPVYFSISLSHVNYTKSTKDKGVLDDE